MEEFSVGYPFQIQQSWGIASARHTSGCVVPLPPPDHSSPEWLFDAPVGPSVVRWDARTHTRVLQFQAHRDLITCMRLSPDLRHIATSCYSGEVKLWSGDGWQCEDVTQAPMAQQHHLAWSSDSRCFLVVGNGFSSSVVMYSVSQSSGKYALKLLWQVKTESDSAVEENEGQTKGASSGESSEGGPASQKSGKDYHYGNAFTMAEINPSGSVFAVEERKNGKVFVHLFSNGGKHLKCVDFDYESVVLLSTYHSGLGVYGMVIQGGHVIVLCAESLEMKSTFKVGYVSRSCVWDGESLILPSDSGKLVWWSILGMKLFEATVGPPDYIVRLDWSTSGNALWKCGFSTLTYVEVMRNDDGAVAKLHPAHALHGHDISCCGVGFSESGRSLVAGDLGGGVWVMEGENSSPTHISCVAASVRCLVWWGESCVLIGCLDGKVYRWSEQEELKMMCEIGGSVIVMKWDHSKQWLAMGSSKGVLSLFEGEVSGKVLNCVTSFTAHPPHRGNKDMRFGQLSKQAEIWSLCWSPDDSQLATCSEDQTTKIWSTDNWSCLSVLRGHTMAVTSVDWRMTGGKGIIATCSDDRTVRVVDSQTYEVIQILSTYDLHGWHTLTYLTLHPPPSPTLTSSKSSLQPLLVTCTTQNGYVVVWNVDTGHRITSGRIHCGSVEGLAWNENTGCLATVGADCVTHLFRLNV